MLKIIVESPYTQTRILSFRGNIFYASQAMRHCFDRGEAPFASHLLYPGKILSEQYERELGLLACYEWMKVCDIVAFYLDRGWSPGMIRALRMARSIGKRIELRQILNAESAPQPTEVRNLLPKEVVTQFYKRGA